MVAEECSFTRAAARLGVSQSALSQTIRAEARLDLRLFARTTRSVSLTEAGERLLKRVGPAMSEIDAGLEEIGELIGKPTGVIRLTADEFAVQSVLQPAIARFLPGHPGIRIEITTDYGLADIVDGRFDAGVRRGRLVAKDMIAVRIGRHSDGRRLRAVVSRPAPGTQAPVRSRVACINLRLPTHGEFLPWIFTRASNEHRIKVDGPLVYTSIAPVRDAALAGLGRLSARGVRAHCACVRATDRGAGCMAQDVRGLPPLLREPAARDLRVLAAGRRAEIPQA